MLSSIPICPHNEKTRWLLRAPVYRKQTHTERYLHADSHHHPSQKIDIINTLVTRAITIVDKDHLKHELNHLMKALIKNRYKEIQIKETIRRANKREGNNIKKNEKENNNKETSLAILPYIHGTTNKIARILRKRDIRVTFSPPNSLSNMLDSTKDLFEKKLLQGVYTIPCSCDKVYIGETGRSIKTRLKEHGVDIHHCRIKNSSVAKHSCDTKHHIRLEKAEVLATIPHHFK